MCGSEGAHINFVYHVWFPGINVLLKHKKTKLDATINKTSGKLVLFCKLDPNG